jgi:hypothetical protein
MHGTPTRIKATITPGCQTIDRLAGCLQSNAAEFTAIWDWNDAGMISLTPAGAGDKAGVLIAYQSPAGVRASEKGGP